MQIDELVTQFKTYCQRRFPSNTGTAVSYTNAVRYLLEFMNVAEISNDLFSEIKSIEPDIRDSESILYGELQKHFEMAGRESYLKKGFLKAALSVLFDFEAVFSLGGPSDAILIREIRDNQITVNFSGENLHRLLPTASYTAHNYNVRRVSGTSEEATKKVRSGRKAEKYFISFLTKAGFVQNVDFFDVANNKNYGFDVRFHDVGLEIKNIKSGAFYLSDNEIARLENTNTHLILVDIDNGIWLLKKESLWLKNAIKDIKEVRAYGETHFSNLDISDIKILIDDSIRPEAEEISDCTKERIIEMLK